jgi:hypothetical protein
MVPSGVMGIPYIIKATKSSMIVDKLALAKGYHIGFKGT